MPNSAYYLPLYDGKGNLYAVMLSAEIWAKTQKQIEPIITAALNEIAPQQPAPEQSEPMEDWQAFKDFWDFKYPICSDVSCGNCNAHTNDWLTDPAKPFRLRSAQLGGLIVFNCANCGAIVRKKHFKDHYCFEFTPKNP